MGPYYIQPGTPVYFKYTTFSNLPSTWDDMAVEFGLNVFGDIKVPKACFTEPMRKYCGKTLTIVRKNHYLSPNSDCYYFGGSTMVFTSLMFEQSYPTVVSSTLSFDDLLKGAAAQLANPQA